MIQKKIILSFLLLTSSIHAIKHPEGFITLNECIQNGCKVNFVLHEKNSKEFVLTLENGVVVDEGAIVTNDGKILTDTTTYKQDQQKLLNNNRDITKENPIYYDGSLAVISSPGQQCYYHWLLQVLPRLKILQESKINYDKIYLYSNNFKFRWQQESLFKVMDKLEIPRNKILLTQESTVLQAKKLLVPSVAWNPAIEGIKITNWYKNFMFNVFLTGQKIETPKRIFISRSKANYRRITNEQEINNLLTKKGFVSLHLEDLPISNQANLFHNAQIIIGPHGAGFTNLIFCKPETKIIEIDHGVKGINQRSSYKVISEFMNFDYHAFYVDLLNETEHPDDINDPINQDMTVDLKKFDQFCNDLGI